MRRIQNVALHALALGGFLGAAGAASGASFSYTALNAAGASVANPIAANSHDYVVGNVGNIPSAGFVWVAGKLTLVSGAPVLEAINDDGIAVGAASKSTVYASYNTKTGQLTDVPIPFCHNGKYSECYALGINSTGEVVGGAGGRGREVGFLWRNGAAQKILPPKEKQSTAVAINSGGTILVTGGNAFVDRKGKFTEISFPEALSTVPSFLTDRGIAGGIFNVKGSSFGFVFSDGDYTSYAPAAATSSDVVGIGANGQIFGTFVDANGKTHGFEYVSGTYYQIDVPNSTYTTISGVGASGMIFGIYTDSKGTYGYVGTCPKKEVCTQ